MEALGQRLDRRVAGARLGVRDQAEAEVADLDDSAGNRLEDGRSVVSGLGGGGLGSGDRRDREAGSENQKTADCAANSSWVPVSPSLYGAAEPPGSEE